MNIPFRKTSCAQLEIKSWNILHESVFLFIFPPVYFGSFVDLSGARQPLVSIHFCPCFLHFWINFVHLYSNRIYFLQKCLWSLSMTWSPHWTCKSRRGMQRVGTNNLLSSNLPLDIQRPAVWCGIICMSQYFQGIEYHWTRFIKTILVESVNLKISINGSQMNMKFSFL